MEKINPKQPSQDNRYEEKSGFDKLRKYTIAGFGAAAVASSAFYKDDLGRDALEIAHDHLTMGVVENMVSKLTLEDKKKYEALAAVIVPRLGTAQLAMMTDFEADVGSESAPLQVTGFEETGLITNEDIKKATSSSFFPADWITGKIASIRYEPGLLNLSKYTQGLAANVEGGPLEKDQIIFNSIEVPHDTPGVQGSVEQQRAYYKTLAVVIKTMRHEVCHSNDWTSRSMNTFIDRLELLAKVIERTDSPDQFAEHLVVDDDGKIIPYHTLGETTSRSGQRRTHKEYFADICAEYLKDPLTFLQKYPKDYKIVDDWVTKSDKTFKISVPDSGPFDPRYGDIQESWKTVFETK